MDALKLLTNCHLQLNMSQSCVFPVLFFPHYINTYKILKKFKQILWKLFSNCMLLTLEYCISNYEGLLSCCCTFRTYKSLLESVALFCLGFVLWKYLICFCFAQNKWPKLPGLRQNRYAVFNSPCPVLRPSLHSAPTLLQKGLNCCLKAFLALSCPPPPSLLSFTDIPDKSWHL